MIETNLCLIVNRKEDIELIENILRNQKVQSPIFILEFEDSFKINFMSDYEQWEMDKAIINAFPNYEFKEDLGNGRKEIRIQLSRQHSPFSTDGWGRPIDYPMNETKYLIKKSKEEITKFSPQIKVLFEDLEKYYYVNIINGINKANNQKGYLVLEEFREYNKEKDVGFLKNSLFENPMNAFSDGLREIDRLAYLDFQDYLKAKKRNKKK
jgi:hypothetical protein